MARAAPDGYTVLFTPNSSHGINPHMFRKLGFDPVKEFQPVTTILTLGFVLVVDTPWFAQTNAQGQARLSYSPAADQQLRLWHPRIADPVASLSRALPAEGRLSWQLAQPLKRDPRPKPPRNMPSGKGGYVR